jgi:RNA polymerase sigma factor (sigma-70 family)
MAVEQTDAQLVSRCRAGDPDAWNEFVERFSRYVYAICGRGFRLSQQDAEDVFQEVFARAFERLSELRSDEAVRPWLAQLTRRLCIDRLRLIARDTPSDVEPDEREVDDVLAQLDEAMAVRAALDKVGDPCREILTAFSAATRAIARSATCSRSRPGPSPAGSRAAWRKFVANSMEGVGPLARHED